MDNVNGKKIIAILGPTASGKTELALRLAKKYNGYIISADSRQVYKNMNIGTAKPLGRVSNIETRIKKMNKVYTVNGIPHFLMDSIEPNKSFTLADWLKIVKKILNSQILNSKYKIPIICGGTGLYISALVDNYQLPVGKIDLRLRKNLEKNSLLELLKKLKKIDKPTYKNIDKTNKRKIIRALEFSLTNNISFTSSSKNKKSSYEFLQIGLNIPRQQLYKRINNRVIVMMKNGLIKETKFLIKKYNTALPALSSIGYKQVGEFLNGAITKQQAIENIQRDSRHYAKRQITWFRRDNRIQWINNYLKSDKLVKNFLQK